MFPAYALKFLVHVKMHTWTSNRYATQVGTSSHSNWCDPKMFCLARFHCIPTDCKFICVKFKKKNNNVTIILIRIHEQGQTK